MQNNQQAHWNEKVSILKGISIARAKQLEKLDIYTVGDLAGHFPRRYEDWTSISAIANLENGTDGVFLGRVEKVPTVFRKGKRAILQVSLRDPSGLIRGIWFNQAYLQDKLVPGEIYLFRGRIKRETRSFQVINPQFTHQAGLEFPALGESIAAELAETFVRPVYPATQGLGQTLLRGFVEQALALVLPEIEETLPQVIRQEEELAGLAWSYEQIHNPEHLENYKIARRRLAFDELFYLQLGLRLNKSDSLKKKAIALDMEKHPEQVLALKRTIEALPFALTNDQKKALKETLNDMNKAVTMNRLLQGDVGSGKTIVAFLAMCAFGFLGKQSVLMAPTSILAKQHEANFRKLLPHIPDEQIVCLTGDTKAKEKREIYKRLEEGEILYLIGTHAVIQKNVKFSSLALAVTDEQHRFGVKQRLELTQEEQAHILVMSATPIPRTLGLVVYGDLDVSIIAEKPPGRKDVQTFTARSKDKGRLIKLIERFVERGEQVYIVAPMVNESEEMDLQSASELYERLQNTSLSHLRLGLLHGQMKEKEKQAIMTSFLNNEISVLIATTVIEVGVDNPNASFMIILNAERFGLAQLHQLRGRVGRGSQEALCVLFSDVGDGIARERLTTMCKTNDGFEIAEADLKLRGPGDFFGTRQHGLPSFKVANLYEDQLLLSRSANWVQTLLRDDPELMATEHKPLRLMAQRFLANREQ